MRGCFLVLLVLGACSVPARDYDLSRDGVKLQVSTAPDVVDPGRDFEVTVTMTVPDGTAASLPDLRDRFRGFSVAEDFAEEPVKEADGATTIVSRWRLVPEPRARRYRLAPFVVGSFFTSAIVFDPPPAPPAVTGAMEIAPRRDLPPLSAKLLGICAAVLAAFAALVAIAYLIVRKIRLMVKIHRMSPVERAMYELDVLLRKGLPGRGFYKDFYVELTMVVRRYIERCHSVKAPNLTTDEFLQAAKDNPAFSPEALAGLRQFLESADLVKFAGVEATPETADAATDSARDYIRRDAAASTGKGIPT